MWTLDAYVLTLRRTLVVAACIFASAGVLAEEQVKANAILKPGTAKVLQANPKPKTTIGGFTKNPPKKTSGVAGSGSLGPNPPKDTKPRSYEYPDPGNDEQPYDSGGGSDYGGYDYGGGGGGGGYYPGPEQGQPQATPQQQYRGVQGNLMQQSTLEMMSAPVELQDKQKAQAEGDGEDLRVEPRTATVWTRDMTDAKALMQLIGPKGYRAKQRSSLESGGVFTRLEIPSGQTVAAAIAELKAAFPTVVFAPSTRYTLMGSGKQFASSLINWNAGSRQCGVSRKIALLDTPVDTQHPALRKARIVAQNLVPAGTAPPPADHGTAIATLLVGDPASEHPGLVPDTQLLAFNVYRQRDKKTVDTNSELIIKGMDKAVRAQVDVINLSLGGPPNAVLEVVIRNILARQIFVVAAAGNNGAGAAPVYPAAYPGVLAVTAVDADRKVYAKANQGAYVEFAAPGVDVWSGASGGKSRYHSGTSFAAPFVTASVAALRGMYPTQPASELYQRLTQASEDLGNPGRDPVFGWGLVRSQWQCPQVASGQ